MNEFPWPKLYAEEDWTLIFALNSFQQNENNNHNV